MRCLSMACVLLVLMACPKSAPPSDVSTSPDAGASEAELIAPKVDAVEQEIAAVVNQVDEALWRHWTTGAPLDLAAATKGHPGLFSAPTLELLRKARALRPADAVRVDRLTRWLEGELLSRGVAAESETVANLEASETFSVDGKELAFRDLSKLLVSEKSAVKRRALWSASHSAALHLDAAIARRDAKLQEVLSSLGLPAPLQFAAAARQLELDLLAKEAEEVLTSTEGAWKDTLQGLSDAELKLPLTALTRGDLPRLLKVSATVDAEFPKAQVAVRAVQTLGTLGVYGRPGLTLDLAEAGKKNPLPLTVAPTPKDVRVSVRPLGGLRDQQLVLGELGAALALHQAREASFTEARLDNPVRALTWSALFSMLPEEEAWLAANGVANREQVIAAARAQHMFALRRAAGVVLATMETDALGETEARARYVAIMARALGLSLAPEEGARWRLDTGDFLRTATQLDAMVRATRWRTALGSGWWEHELTAEFGRAALAP